MPDVRIDVYADTHGAPKNLKDVDTALDGVTAGAARADKASGGLWKQFAIGQLAVQALHKAFGLLKDIVGDSIKNAIEQEDADRALTAALEITGRTVQGNLRHYLDFAAAQQKVTLYTDEEIEATQTLLLQMTSLNQNGIDRATKGAMGLASTLGITLESATQKVMLAMKGQEIGLGRVGIKVAENLTAEEKQASLLDQLEKLYQRSTAEVDTFGGSLKQLKKSWDETLETAGMAVLKNEAVQEAIKGVKKWVDELAASPGFALWLNEASRLLTGLAKLAEKVPKSMPGLSDWLMGVSAQEAGLARETIKLNAAYERFIAAGHGWHGTTVAITAATQAAIPVINEIGNVIDDLGTTKITNTLLPALRNIAPVTETAVNTAITAINRMGWVWHNAIDKMQDGPEFITKAFKKEVPKWLQAVQNALNKEVQAFSAALNQIDATLQQSTNNRMLNLDNEYQKRLDLIKSSLMSEEEKNAAIEGLDAEYNMKRRKVQREAAQEGKLIAIFNAIINVAEGMTKALAQGGIFGPILAAVVAAFGAIQIGLIRAQPIPLAAGAIFKKPVFSGGYEAGEAGPEAVIPLSELPRLMREIGGDRGRGYRTERPIITQVHIFLDSREMKKFNIKTIREAGQHGFLGRVGKEMA